MKKVISRNELTDKGNSLVFRHKSKQILLLETNGSIFALDNRCPHEGYPLQQGTTDSKTCVLTCNWHNWKFDLKTGKCLLGADNVRTYPVLLEKDNIVIDLEEPTSDTILQNFDKNLKTAFTKRQYGRTAREITRLMFHKHNPLIAVEKAILWSYEKLEFGTTHAYAAAADWLDLYDKCTEREDKIICLTEAVDHIALDTLRHKYYPFSAKADDYCPHSLLAAIEHEDLVKAESLVANGFDRGLCFQDFEETLSKAALNHYNDFGHSLIYVVKSAQLSKIYNNPDIDKALVLSLVRSITYATREDLLPEFKKYKETLQTLESSPFGKGIPKNILNEKNVSSALNWLVQEHKNSAPRNLYTTLLSGNAKNLLYFNKALQNKVHDRPGDNIGWFDFTHGLTFANAVRITCEKFSALWSKGLLQMACFYGRNRPYIDEAINKEDWIVSSKTSFESRVRATILDHGINPPIYSAHIIKTSLAVFEEAKTKGLDQNIQEILYAALNHFISSPIKQKHPRRTAHQAINLVSKDFH